MLFVNNAQAQEAITSSFLSESGWSNLIPMVLILVVFYFLLIRPQQKRMKEHNAMIKALARGDEVVTAGGIIGKISKVEEKDDTVWVEIATDVKVRVKRSTITGKIVNEPVSANQNDKSKQEKGAA